MAKGKRKGGKLFEKGVSGNPTGRPTLGPEMNLARTMTRTVIIGAICKAMTSKVSDSEILADNPYATGADALMASVMMKAIEMGCPSRAQFFMSYLFGRPAQYDPKDDMPPPAYTEKMDSVPSQAIIRAIKEAQANAEQPVFT